MANPPAFTRRATAQLLLGGAMIPLLPGFAAARGQDDWARRFQAELDDRFLRIREGRVVVTGFGVDARVERTTMAALVRFDWPPGTRLRRFDAVETDGAAALARLVSQTVDACAAAWPGCFR